MKRKAKKKQAKFQRHAYNPKAKVVVVKADADYGYMPPGRFGMAWTYMGEGLVRNAPYDAEGMHLVRKLQGNLVDTGGMKGMIDRVVPYLSPERKAMLLEKMHKVAHAKQRKLEAEERKARGYAESDEPNNRARRLSKNEKKKKRRSKSWRDSLPKL